MKVWRYGGQRDPHPHLPTSTPAHLRLPRGGEATKSHRLEKVNDLLRDELSGLIAGVLHDPRLAMVSVTEVETAPDLRFARVFVSIMGDEDQQRETLRALRGAAGFLRRELGRRVTLRYLPALDFQVDQSIERGRRILDLIKEVQQG